MRQTPTSRSRTALADAADAITLARFRARDLAVETKPDLTPVSEADRAAEEAIRELVASERPGEGVLGEEFGDDGAATRWIVDPIDGTMNYVRGIPVWATLLALERDGVVEVGARLGAGARPPLVGGARRGRVGGRRRARAASRRSRGSRTAPLSTTSPRELPPGWAELVRPRVGGPRPQRLLAALPRRRGRRSTSPPTRIVALWDYAAVAPDRRGGRRPLHDLRRRRPGAGGSLAEHERRRSTTTRRAAARAEPRCLTRV